MKKILLLVALFICLQAVLSSQTNNELINNSFLITQNQLNHGQIISKQLPGKEFHCIRQNQSLKKNKKYNEIGSVIYRPIKVNCDDTLRYTYTYDNSGNLLTELAEKWSNNAWVISARATYNYDNSGNVLTDLGERWSNNAWVNSYRRSYTYDNSNHILSFLMQEWFYTWVNSYRYTYTYDNSGNQLIELYEYWSNNTWVISERYTYTYDNSGNRLTELYEYWSNNAWVNSERYTLTYDNIGRLLTELGEYWSNNVWENSNRSTYTYDNSGNRLTELYEFWSNNAWVNISRRTYTYDNNGNGIYGESTNWQDSAWVKHINALQLSYNNHQDYLSFYAAVVNVEYTLITDIASEQLNMPSFNLQQNYPNPFNPSTKISWQLPDGSKVSLKVYDLLGREVATLVNEYKQAGKFETEFYSANLPSGVYFYRIQAGEFIDTKKMILTK